MKAVISGYGRMGHMVEKILLEKGIEIAGKSEDIASFDDVLAAECICIDFTVPAAFRTNYPVLASKFAGVVVGTTGWNDIKDEVISCFRRSGTPLIYASNFSIGVNTAFALASLAAKILSQRGYNASIVETHHIHKLDAPSGTAVTLAGVVKDGFVSGGMNDGNIDIPIESRREGEVAGIHELSFESASDRITIVHEAFSREGFARGAVLAASMIADGKVSGVHEFKELVLL